MSDSSSGSGGAGLLTLISGIYAYATSPALVGLKGAFGAAMIGTGTSIVTGTFALGGAAVGGLAGGLVGAATGRAKEGAIAGAILVGIGSGLYGIPTGYGLAKDIVVNGITADQQMTHANDSKPRIAYHIPNMPKELAHLVP